MFCCLPYCAPPCSVSTMQCLHRPRGMQCLHHAVFLPCNDSTMQCTCMCASYVEREDSSVCCLIFSEASCVSLPLASSNSQLCGENTTSLILTPIGKEDIDGEFQVVTKVFVIMKVYGVLRCLRLELGRL